MTSPPSDSLEPWDKKRGSWFELRDPNGRVLYRRIVHTLIPKEVEVPTGERQSPYTCEPLPDQRGRFTLLIPDIQSASTLVLFYGPPEEAHARELCRFDLKSPPGLKGPTP